MGKNMTRKPLIYVSSTFTDLKEHRAALKSALEKAHYDVECMEKYPAFDERPLDKCLVDVQRADVYVLVLAHRYGFRPKHDNPARKSITQLEYEEAGRQANKPRLVFTVDDDHPWSPKLVDTGKNARDLLAFRAEVEGRHGVNRFSDPHHLSSLVLQALNALNVVHRSEGEAQDVGPQYAHGKSIAQASGPGTSVSVEDHERHHHHYPAAPPVSWNWPRPWDFSGYLAEKRAGFTGRDWLFDEVRAWYEDNNGARALLVCADFGVGKSAFMAELASDPHGLQIAAYHFCHHDTIETLNPGTFVRSVAAQLADSLPDYRSAVDADPDARRWLDDVQLDPASAFERAVVGPLNTICAPGAPQILLVDAVDEALVFETAAGCSRPTTLVRLLAGQAKHLPAWLRVLATSRRIQGVLQPIQRAFQCAMLDGEDLRNLADIRSYVTGRCVDAKLARALERGTRSASEIAAWLSGARQSGGKFLYAVSVLDAIESGKLPLDRLDALPTGMDAFYLDAFERRFPKSEDYAPVGALLGVLCVQLEPLSQADLAANLCTTESRIESMLRRLEDFLRIRGQCYAFDHLSLSQWLTQKNEATGFRRAGRFSVAPKDAEALIAGWTRREIAVERAHESPYLARHLSAYLSLQERQVQYARLLFDFRWLDARLRAAGVNALLMDFADVDGTPALRALARALRHSAHVLGHDGTDWRGADLLASQLLGRLQSHPEAEIRALCAQAAVQLARDSGWRPLTDSLRLTEALSRALVGHTAPVLPLVVLTDGRLASGSSDKTIRLWNTTTGVCEATLEGHTGTITALAALTDGRLASGSYDCTIRLWNPASGVCEATLEEHTSRVTALAVLADGRLASGSEDRMIRLWSPVRGSCEETLTGHKDAVRALAVLADERLASGSWDGTIKLWDPASGICEVTLDGHAKAVYALAQLADGRLASGSKDATIKLWSLANGACEATLEGHTGDVFALAVLADGRLASASDDDTIRLWNPVHSVCDTTLGRTGAVFGLAVLADGRLASGSRDATIKLWNPVSGICEATREGHTGWVNVFAVLADGRLASGSRDNTIKLWNPASGVCEATLEGHTSYVSALAVLADGRLASGSYDSTIRLWNPASGVCERTMLDKCVGQVFALAVLADGRLASGSYNGSVSLWDPTSGAYVATLERWWQPAPVDALTVLADGRLASASRNHTITLWNPATDVCEATLERHPGDVLALAMLRDGRLASASYDRAIRLWNLATGLCEATLEGHTDAVRALVVLADGRLASASSDRTIRVWQFHNGRWRGVVHFVADADVRALAFVARAGVLAAGDESGRVHFLKVEAAETFPA
jgi:WD40 repeat protein